MENIQFIMISTTAVLDMKTVDELLFHTYLGVVGRV